MKIGIVGLPFSGKTTLFNALTGETIATVPSGGGKADAHQSVVKVPDSRLDALDDIFKPKKKTPATVDYIDLAGVNPDQQKSQGFSDQFLGQLRTVDAVLVIVRHFQDDNIPHPLNTIDPHRDTNTIQSEFILSDLSIIENRLERLERQLRAKKDDQDAREQALLKRLQEALENEQPLRQLEIGPDEEKLIRGYQFLTLKPLIIVLNIGEADIGHESEIKDRFSALQDKTTVILPISAQIESEIQQLSEEEAEDFRKDVGITHSARDRLIRTSYELLGLISFFTVGEDEVRAWTIKQNTPAPEAAGVIHSDIERGFIRAEVVHYDDFITRKSLAQCRNDGILRLEGRDYRVSDGDIINFRFAV